MPVIYIDNEFREVTDREAMRLVLSGGRLVHQDAWLSYKYADNIIQGPWPPGESVIADSARHSYMYALFVIRGPWPPGEAAMRSDPVWWNMYRKNFPEVAKREHHQ